MKKLLLTLGSITAIATPVSAVVACGENTPPTTTPPKTTPPETLFDEKFQDAELIENFDITKETANKYYTYDKKNYDDLASVLVVWTKEANSVLTKYFATAGFAGTTTTTSIEDGKIKFDVVKAGASILDHGEVTYNSVEQLMGDFAKQISGKVTTDWIRDNRIIEEYKEGEHSIDSIIYSQAQTLTNVIKTDHDTAYINKFGGSYIRENKELDLTPYKKWADFNTLTAEYRPGDSIIFAFDNEKDMASFTQRVRYDNTSDYSNNMPIADVDRMHIKYQPISIDHGQIMAANVDDYSVGNDISIFKLEVIARNAVELTFNDIFKPGSSHIDAQLLYLSAFRDENKDGEVNSSDVSMVQSFMVDKNKIYSNYNTKEYIHEDQFIAGYDEAKATLGK